MELQLYFLLVTVDHGTGYFLTSVKGNRMRREIPWVWMTGIPRAAISYIDGLCLRCIFYSLLISFSPYQPQARNNNEDEHGTDSGEIGTARTRLDV